MKVHYKDPFNLSAKMKEFWLVWIVITKMQITIGFTDFNALVLPTRDNHIAFHFHPHMRVKIGAEKHQKIRTW